MDHREAVVRRSGRPDAQATEVLNRHILSTATRLFVERGYAATSMEQIAAVAGAGKQTIYRRYPSKEVLFNAVVSAMSEQLLRSAVVDDGADRDPLGRLREIARASLDLVTSAEAVAIYRILIAEAQRFPGLVDHTIGNISEPIERTLVRLLKAARRRGSIRSDVEPKDAARVLISMTTGWSIQQNLLGRRGLEAPSDRKSYFEGAWSIFLDGITAHPGSH
jgi:AcrR family transcriptional regulator